MVISNSYVSLPEGIGYHPWNLQKHRSQVKKKTETLSAKRGLRGLSGSAGMDRFLVLGTKFVAEN